MTFLTNKDTADRLAATCKSYVRIFINEGNDVTTAHQLKDALLSHGGRDRLRVVSKETIGDLVEDRYSIFCQAPGHAALDKGSMTL